MKTIRFVFFLVLTLTLFYFLNNSFYGAPPLGPFLSPHQGFWQNGEKEPIDLPELLELEGLRNEVSIQFDELLIPHISAQNKSDLYFAQGYVTAYHRLWQMDFYSRVVLGRLSEVIGEKALEYDRLNRRIGLHEITRKMYEETQKDPALKVVIDSYAAGVNAYIGSLSPSDYPVEFKLLNYKPEEWSPLKSCVVYALMSSDLSRGESDLENTNALSIFGPELFDQLFPDQTGNISPVIPSGTAWNFTPIAPGPSVVDFPLWQTKNTLPKPDPLNGSNNFVLSATKTRTGNVMLANEPDLRLTAPSIWYATHLSAPGLNVMGVTVPGTPMIIIGFNDSIAWGVTNSPKDQVDWYAIQFRDNTRSEYLYENKWFKTESRIEQFSVKGNGIFTDTIIYVHHGPVVYDRSFGDNSEISNYAMRWIAHDRPSSFRTFDNLNHAKNYADFSEAVSHFSGPPQNFIFGSSAGDIALDLPGKFPVKWEGQGKFLMDGSRASHEWTDLIPHEHRLKRLNHPQGFLSSANQHQADSLYPYYVYDHMYEYYRNRRINERLQVMANVTPKDMMKLQNDNFNYHAFESLPAMMDSLDTASFNAKEWEYYSILQSWDYFNEPDLAAPSIYELWWESLYNAIWDEFDTINIQTDKPNKYVTVNLMRTNPEFQLFDILGTPEIETAQELYLETFRTATDSLEKWKLENGIDISWYKFKSTQVTHLLPGLDPFNIENIRIGGNKNIVNAASKYHGPSWRMVVELSPNGSTAYAVYPGSQTGNPGNPNYGKMVEQWASGDYHLLHFGTNPLRSEEVLHQLIMKPGE